MHPLLEALAARSTAHIVIQRFSSAETDRVTMPRAHYTCAISAIILNISVQQWTTHVVASGIDSMNLALVRDESLRKPQ